MISADFYPTSTNAYGRQYTAYLNDLSNSYDTLEGAFAPYIMGYTDPNNVPDWTYSTLFETVVSSTAANSYVQFTDIRRVKNVPWFFMCRYATSLQSYTPVLYRNNNNKWSKPFSSTTSYSFFNAANISNIGSNYPVVSIMFYDDDAATPTRLYSSAYAELSPQFFDDASLSITIYQPSEQSINLSLSDFDELGWFTKKTNENHTIHGFISSVTTTPTRDVSSGGYNNYSNSCVCYYIEYDNPIIENAAHIVSSTPYAKLGSSNNPYFTINSSNFSITGSKPESNMIVGGFVGKIPGTFIQTSTGNDIYVSDENNFVAYNIGTGIQVYRIIKPSEIKKLFSIGTRYISSSVSGYRYGFANDVFVPLFNDDDSPKLELISGTLSDIQSQLRPWQYGAITDNDFTIDDIPEYQPEPPDEDEESGQSIPIQRRLSMGAVSSFITCYGLTAAQVQEFGKKLWSSWVDNGGLVMAMVENFKFLIDSGIASNTGSIDISSVLDFVVSLKVYPCDIRNLFAFSNSDSDGKVYIGRGTYGLEVSNSAIYKAINQLGYLDAGTYNVPRPFGDFRDYTNINITVYVPYCGTIELNPADVIGRTLSGTYVVDVMTGECTFFLEVVAVTDSGEHRYIVGTCDGQLGVTIPVSATNSGQIAARRFSDVAQFATTVGGFFNRNMQIGNDIAMQMATLGASGMASKNPEMASAREQNIKMTGSQAYADNALGLLKDVTGQFGNSLTRAAIDAPNISGGSGIASFANPDCVWIQIRHGIYPKVNNYDHTVGKVSTKSAPLSSYHGFTVCHNVDVSNLPCTEEEKSAIKQLLETGVYL